MKMLFITKENKCIRNILKKVKQRLQTLNEQYERKKDEQYIENYSGRYIRKKGYMKF